MKAKLLEALYNHENDFIGSFTNKREGVRQFDCLIYLVEEGSVDENNIFDYGFEKEWLDELEQPK